jgi:putative intracellular protease/amidase
VAGTSLSCSIPFSLQLPNFIPIPPNKATNFSQSEFAHPYNILAPHTSITVASPKGGAAPLDPNSVAAAADDTASQTFLSKETSLWESTVPLSSVSAADYAAIIFVGGHGPMFDLATDATSHALIRDFYAQDKVIAAVCHGPAALINVVLEDGKPLLEGLKVTGFTDSEERAVGVEVPFSLEQRLDQASGGGFVRAGDWQSNVEVGRHGKFITGQNPTSAEAVGKAVYEALFGGK